MGISVIRHTGPNSHLTHSSHSGNVGPDRPRKDVPVPGHHRSTPALLPVVLSTLLAVPGTLTLLAVPADAAPQRAASTSTVGRPWPGHRDRRVLTYRVRAGDTAAGIATKFHAWTAELRGINAKSPTSAWYVGERVRVPVVVSRARAHGHAVGDLTHGRSGATTARSGPRATRTQVRRVLVRTAREHDVPRNLALAVAWHESGWQQQVRSPVGAIGVMQVMPGNRAWLSEIVGRPLRLKDLDDNVTAGVVLLKLLRASQGARHGTLSAYYQGQGSVRENGLYESTKHYIANVRAVQERLDKGWRPDRS